MRKFSFLFVPLCLLAVELTAHANPPGSLTGSSGAFTPNSTGEIDTTTGYMGTATYNLNNTTGASVSYYLCYEVDVYIDSGEYAGWNQYQVGYVSTTAVTGNNSYSVDFTADLTTGIPEGTYNVSIFVATVGTGGVVGTILTTGGDGDNTNAMVPTAAEKGKSDPLPNPEPPPGPDPGDNPPVEYPILPPSGPSGPGSITNKPYTDDGGGH